jgi:membrane associated rhomboid family serine protease
MPVPALHYLCTVIDTTVSYSYTLGIMFPNVKDAFMKNDYRIARKGEAYRMLSALFMHGHLAHLVVNCMSLSTIGSQVCYECDTVYLLLPP